MLLKKGVSPLVATVLLLAFSVVLGVIVMNFSATSVEDMTSDAEHAIDSGIKCTVNLPLNILRKNNEMLICYNRTKSKNLEFILENKGSVAADGIRIFLLDSSDNIKTLNVMNKLNSHDTGKYNISIALTNDGSDFVFPPTKILISPLLSSGSGLVICDDNRIDLEDISECI